MTNDPYRAPHSAPQTPGHYQAFPPNQYGPSPEGTQHAQTSLVFGIVGFFFLGIIFGPLAISQANKAESHRVPSTAGKVLGWIDTVFGILGILVFFALFLPFVF